MLTSAIVEEVCGLRVMRWVGGIVMLWRGKRKRGQCTASVGMGWSVNMSLFGEEILSVRACILRPNGRCGGVQMHVGFSGVVHVQNETYMSCHLTTTSVYKYMGTGTYQGAVTRSAQRLDDAIVPHSGSVSCRGLFWLRLSDRHNRIALTSSGSKALSAANEQARVARRGARCGYGCL